MYVCICKGITEKQIQDAVSSRNTNNPKEVLKALGVGTDCGTCVEDAVSKLLEKSARAPFEMKDTSNNS
ncbi:MAG: (2Fe-2S)-binding protein [Bacteriovoracaceae bacterium]